MDKDYRSLFQEYSDNEQLTLIVVTTGSYDSIRTKLMTQMKGFRNVRLEFFTLPKLKEYCRRIARELKANASQTKEVVCYANSR
jgi:hypothetical protein